MWPVLFHPNTGQVVPGTVLYGFVSLHWDTACIAQEHDKSWSRSEVSGRRLETRTTKGYFPGCHIPYYSLRGGAWLLLHSVLRQLCKWDYKARLRSVISIELEGWGRFGSSQMPLLINARVKAEAETDESKQHCKRQKAVEEGTW